jgi:hypothetical protein
MMKPVDYRLCISIAKNRLIGNLLFELFSEIGFRAESKYFVLQLLACLGLREAFSKKQIFFWNLATSPARKRENETARSAGVSPATLRARCPRSVSIVIDRYPPTAD